jgi:23S rRNA G2069 N7-methylase RlmK/C1962 C5-methylase RlmI
MEPEEVGVLSTDCGDEAWIDKRELERLSERHSPSQVVDVYINTGKWEQYSIKNEKEFILAFEVTSL